MKYLIVGLFLIGMLQACNSPLQEKNLLWSDEFNDNESSLAKHWNIIEGNGCPNNCGFGNNEFQDYTNKSSNISVQDGHLLITAHHHKEDSSYTSAKITTEGKGDWKYGYFEIRAQLPSGRGTWPAIWMLPSQKKTLSWPKDGEIDIMEHVGYNQDMIYGTIHTEAYNHQKGTQKSDSLYVANSSEQFHEYALDWQEDYIEWFVDGKSFHRLLKNDDAVSAWPFDKAFHLIINFAVGGDWGGKHGIDATIFPQVMKVDYVRVYRVKPN